jgi:hypothetical protein
MHCIRYLGRRPEGTSPATDLPTAPGAVFAAARTCVRACVRKYVPRVGWVRRSVNTEGEREKHCTTLYYALYHASHYTTTYTTSNLTSHRRAEQSRAEQSKPNTTDPKITNSTQRNARTHARPPRTPSEPSLPVLALLCLTHPPNASVSASTCVYLRLPVRVRDGSISQYRVDMHARPRARAQPKHNPP